MYIYNRFVSQLIFLNKELYISLNFSDTQRNRSGYNLRGFINQGIFDFQAILENIKFTID